MIEYITSYLRVFHVLFWLLLMTGVLFLQTYKTVYICLVVMIMAIMLWNVLGLCVLHLLENHFDSSSSNPSTSFFNEYFSRRFGWTQEAFGKAFEYLIYSIIIIALLRIHNFERKRWYNS